MTICSLLVINGTSSGSSDTNSASNSGQIIKPKIVSISDPSISLSGNGNSAVLIELNPGLAIFNMTHNGSDIFNIRLLDEKGNFKADLVHEDSLISSIEGVKSRVSFNGSKVVGIEEEGLFALDIEADGNWMIKITQPITT
jgi:hypothetical protein